MLISFWAPGAPKAIRINESVPSTNSLLGTVAFWNVLGQLGCASAAGDDEEFEAISAYLNLAFVVAFEQGNRKDPCRGRFSFVRAR